MESVSCQLQPISAQKTAVKIHLLRRLTRPLSRFSLIWEKLYLLSSKPLRMTQRAIRNHLLSDDQPVYMSKAAAFCQAAAFCFKSIIQSFCFPHRLRQSASPVQKYCQKLCCFQLQQCSLHLLPKYPRSARLSSAGQRFLRRSSRYE